MTTGDFSDEGVRIPPARAALAQGQERGTLEIPLDTLGRRVLLHKGTEYCDSSGWTVLALLALCLVPSVLFRNPAWIVLPTLFALPAYGSEMLTALQAFVDVWARRRDLASGTLLRTVGVGVIRAVRKADGIDYQFSVGSDEHSTSWVDLEVEQPGALGHDLLNSAQQGLALKEAWVLRPTTSPPVRIADGDVTADYSRHSGTLFRIADSSGNVLYQYPVPEPSTSAAEANSHPAQLRSFYRRAPSGISDERSPSGSGAPGRSWLDVLLGPPDSRNAPGSLEDLGRSLSLVGLGLWLLLILTIYGLGTMAVNPLNGELTSWDELAVEMYVALVVPTVVPLLFRLRRYWAAVFLLVLLCLALAAFLLPLFLIESVSEPADARSLIATHGRILLLVPWLVAVSPLLALLFAHRPRRRHV